MPSFPCAVYPCEEPAFRRWVNNDSVRLNEYWWTCVEHAQSIREYLVNRSLSWGTDLNIWREP